MSALQGPWTKIFAEGGVIRITFSLVGLNCEQNVDGTEYKRGVGWLGTRCAGRYLEISKDETGKDTARRAFWVAYTDKQTSQKPEKQTN